MKGDQINVMVRTGDTTFVRSSSATVSGRVVSGAIEKESNINWLVVRESTRGGTVVHEAKYQLTDVIMWEKLSA
jgi:hypothetical protein